MAVGKLAPMAVSFVHALLANHSCIGGKVACNEDMDWTFNTSMSSLHSQADLSKMAKKLEALASDLASALPSAPVPSTERRMFFL
jgi:hypothetical protein